MMYKGEIMKFDENKIYFVIFFWTSLIINTLTILFHIISSLEIIVIQEFTGILMLLTLIINFLLIIINFQIIDRKDKNGKMIKNLLWLYLVLLNFSIVFLMIDKIRIAFGFGSQLFVFMFLFFVVIYSIYGFGLLISIFDVKYLNYPKTWK